MTALAYQVEFGEFMRTEREALRLKQHDMAVFLGVSDASISNWERGLVAMSAITERRLRAYFRMQREAQEVSA